MITKKTYLWNAIFKKVQTFVPISFTLFAVSTLLGLSFLSSLFLLVLAGDDRQYIYLMFLCSFKKIQRVWLGLFGCTNLLCFQPHRAGEIFILVTVDFDTAKNRECIWLIIRYEIHTLQKVVKLLDTVRYRFFFTNY